MTRTTKNSQNTPRGKRAAAAAAAAAAAPASAAAAAPAATKQNLFAAKVPVKQEATAGGKKKTGETKYHGCSREELQNIILETREQLKALQNVRTKAKNGKKKGTVAKLRTYPKHDQLKIRSYNRELAELGVELRKRDMRFLGKKGFGQNMIALNLGSTRSIHASVADDVVGDDGCAAEQDVVFSGTDDEVGGAVAALGSHPPCHPWAHSSMCLDSSCCSLPRQTPCPHAPASPAHAAASASNVAMQPALPVRRHTAFLFAFLLMIPPSPPLLLLSSLLKKNRRVTRLSSTLLATPPC